MNELNEKQLLGWQLRRAGKGLKVRIFGAAANPETDWDWRQLSPALGCLIFAALVLNVTEFGERRQTEAVFNFPVSAVNAEAGWQAGGLPPVNRVDNVTFDWTNHSDFKSSIGAQLGSDTVGNLTN